MQRSPKHNATPWVATAIVLMACLCGLTWLLPKESESTREYREAESDARVYTRLAIKQCIDENVRHTVEFVDMTASKATEGNNWLVEGQVQVQNAVGASVRHRFSAYIELIGDKKNRQIKPIAITLDGKSVY